MSGFGGFNSNAGGAFGAGSATTPGKNVFGAAGTGGFGANTAGTSGFGATKTNVFGANTGTGGFGTSGAAGFGTTSTSGTSSFGATSGGLGSTATPTASGFGTANTTGVGGFGSSSLGGFGAKSTASTSGFGAASTGTSGFGTSNAGGFGATNTGTSGFGTSSAGGFGATNTGTSGFGTSSAGGFGAKSTGGFGTSSVGGFGAASTGTSGFGTSSAGGFGAASTASAFGGTGFGTSAFGVAGSGASSSSAPSMFGGFGATASKPTLGTGFGTTNTTGVGAQQQATALFDASELKPWELYDKISSLSEAEVKTFDLGKRQPDSFFEDSQHVPQPQPEKPSLEAPLTKGKLDCIQTFAMPNVDLISDYMAHGNHSVFTSGLYFSDEVTPITNKNLDTLKTESGTEDEDEYDDQELLTSSDSGFLTTPTPQQLSVLPEDELRRVERFSISLPGIGRADYAHPVDLSALIPDFQKNLQLIFKMRQGAFCLSPSQSPYPLKDTGLLGPINVILYNLWLIDPVTGARIYSKSHPSCDALLAPLKQLPGISFGSLDIKLGHWKFTYNYPSST
ncbi:hypothetical protein DSO57_1013194 [Entomophthora muscae]|uniref:Uncharacterized protein n=1 Tax=Entomophthora muscae TaxID=34485 RepID=A0ACC2RKG7_9FUNG|nr:hypothetical protein DSO57_1013194 [Entomophthora muscae]